MSRQGTIKMPSKSGQSISYDAWTQCVIDSGYDFYYISANHFEYGDTGFIFQYCDGEIIVHKPSKKIAAIACDLAERMGAIYDGSR